MSNKLSFSQKSNIRCETTSPWAKPFQVIFAKVKQGNCYLTMIYKASSSDTNTQRIYTSLGWHYQKPFVLCLEKLRCHPKKEYTVCVCVGVGWLSMCVGIRSGIICSNIVHISEYNQIRFISNDLRNKREKETCCKNYTGVCMCLV